jgi:hypothetical protein
MKCFIRKSLLGAAGVVALSLSAHAAGSTAVTDIPLFKSNTTDSLLMAQRNENPGGAGFRNENPGGAGFRNENPGGAGLKKTKKKKAENK